MSEKVPPTYVFADFELDEACFELRRAKAKVDVQPKVLRLLLYLLRHQHRAVSVSELLETLWPNETVTDASIKRAVKGARRALGDSGESQSSIRTVRGLGYRFVLPVQTREGTSDAPLAEPTLVRAHPPRMARDGRYVGREPLLHALDANMRSAFAGSGRLVLLLGEPGIGKTRTALELVRRATAAGADGWFGRCLEEDGAPPFWPWLQIVRDCLRDRGVADTERLLGEGAPDVAQALEELRELRSCAAAAPAIDSMPARFRFFDSMAAFLVRAAAERPLLLVFDDLQRADSDTLRLLAFVARQVERSPVLLLGTSRGSGAGSERVIPMLCEVTTHTAVLSGMTRTELADYLALNTGATSEALVDALYEQTAGNPLFLQQLLMSATTNEHGAVDLDAVRRSSGDAGLRAAIERHLASLPKSTRELLRLAAVLGREFQLSLLAQMVPCDAQSALQTLSSALSAGLLQQTASVTPAYRFMHALIRDALYAQLPAAERARLHAQAGAVLEASEPALQGRLLTEVASHYALAAPTHDGGRALAFAIRVADTALLRLAYHEAAEHCERALGLTTQPAERMQLLLMHAEALSLAGESEPARCASLAALELARSLDCVDALVRVAALLASHPAAQVDEVQLAVLREALTRLPAHDARRHELAALLSRALCFSGVHHERGQLARDARAGARALEDEARARVLQLCHEGLSEPDQLPERLSISDELLELALEMGSTRALMHAWFARLHNHLELGCVSVVDAALDQLDALAEHARDPWFRYCVRSQRSVRAMIAGDFAQAETRAYEAAKLGTSLLGAEAAEHVLCAQTQALWQMQGRLPDAELVVRKFATRFPRLAGWRAVLACIDAHLGRKDHARDILNRLIDRELDAIRRDPLLLSALLPAAELCYQVHDEAAARVLYDAIRPYEPMHGILWLAVATHGPTSRHLGMLAGLLGWSAQAREHVEHSVSAAQAMPSPTFECIASLSGARTLLALEQAAHRERAEQLLVVGARIAQNHGFHGLSYGAAQMARRYDAPLQPNPSSAARADASASYGRTSIRHSR